MCERRRATEHRPGRRRHHPGPRALHASGRLVHSEDARQRLVPANVRLARFERTSTPSAPLQAIAARESGGRSVGGTGNPARGR